MIFINEIPQGNLFECLSNEEEYKYTVEERTELVDYFVTEFPRYDAGTNNLFSFVYGLFDKKAVALADNQADITSLSNHIFSNSRSLSQIEQQILDNTFNRLVKKTPSRPNRL